MWQYAIVFVWAVTVSLATPGWAQPPAPGGRDSGVTPTLLMDRAEIRIFRVVLQPGATRRIHSHDDVEYHVWIPLEGMLQLSVGTDEPTPARPGEAFFLERGTMHGFKNVGATSAAIMEIFVQESCAVSRDELDAIGIPIATLGPIQRRNMYGSRRLPVE